MVKKSMKKLFVGLAVLSTAGSLIGSPTSTSVDTVNSQSKNFFQPRAASINIAREMLMQPATKHRNSEGWYGEFSATAFYQRNWSENSVSQTPATTTTTKNNSSNSSSQSNMSSLGAMPLWSGTNVLNVGNSVTTASTATTPGLLDTYQFGLGTTTINTTLPSTTPAGVNGSISLNPIVYQAGSDFMFIVGSSANEPGFFAKIKAPIAVYNINPQLVEVAPVDAASYPQGALSLSTSAVTVTNTNLTQAFAGNTGTATAEGDYTPMKFGLINGDQSTGAKFGDIELTAGYSFVSNEDNSFSVAVRASAPTGNKATGVYMLEPIVGRGGNWGLGGYAAGHVSLWEGNNDNRLTFKFMSDVMHLFTTETVRSYDLKVNGKGSKNLLIATFGTAGAYQTGSIQNLINVSTLASNSSFGVEGDVAVAFNYAARGWSIDLGYEFYGRSAEELKITGTFAPTTYGVLGHQGVGLSNAGATPSFAVQPYATMQQATAPVADAPTITTAVPVTTPTVVGHSSVLGNLISGADALDVKAAQQAAYLTSKVFTKVAYEWEKSDYVPFLGVMGEFEFSNCLNNALPQWSVAIVGGVSF